MGAQRLMDLKYWRPRAGSSGRRAGVVIVGILVGILGLSEGYAVVAEEVREAVFHTPEEQRGEMGNRLIDLCEGVGELFRQ